MNVVDFKEVGVQDMIDTVHRVSRPSFRLINRFEEIRQMQFLDTQARTHVITESLRASGKMETDYDGRVWSGTIEYGGELTRPPSPGPPADPVDYAIYEKARGGDHDFFSGIEPLNHLYEEAILAHFRRGGR